MPARGYVRYAPTRAMKPLLLRRLLEPTLRRHPRSFVARTIDGARVGGTTRDMIQRYVYLFGQWEPQLTAWLRPRLQPGRTFVDVGANIGYFTLLASRLLGPTGRAVAIEALPETYRRLCDNLTLNHASNVRAVNVAAAAAEGTVTLYGGEEHNSGTTTGIPTSGLVELAQVDALPLTELLQPEEVASARVIKIDVEGAELDVLRGLVGLLEAAPRDLELVVEVSPDDLVRSGAEPHEPIRLLGEYGFVPYQLENDYSLVGYVDNVGGEVAPRRLHHPPTERVDLVFSRTDEAVLP